MAWTTAEIPDQGGRVALVTGATSGLGELTARVLAARGAHVVLGARDEERSRDTEQRIRQAFPDAYLDHVPLDLADLASVAAAARTVRRDHDRLDLVVANAGLMATPHRRTVDGFELHLGVNHLGHHALVADLLGLLLATPGSRVVLVTSLMHRFGHLDRGDLNWERRRYRRWAAYCASKLANLLYVHELDRRLRAAGHDTVAVSAHPGYSRTRLQRTGLRMQEGVLGVTRAAALGTVTRLVAQPPQAGVLPQLYAATARGVPGGSCWGPSGPGGVRGEVARAAVSPRARDAELAGWLWTTSEELTGVRHAL